MYVLFKSSNNEILSKVPFHITKDILNATYNQNYSSPPLFTVPYVACDGGDSMTPLHTRSYQLDTLSLHLTGALGC